MKNVGRAVDFSIEQLSELGGISGCGVCSVFDLNTNNPQYQLVRLITGKGRDKTVLYCSKIDHVERIIRLHHNANHDTN